MTSWAVPAPDDRPAEPEPSPAAVPEHLVDERGGDAGGDDVSDDGAEAADGPWWAEPVEIDPDALPTMLQLDALSAELDEIDAALATMDTRAVTSSAPSGRDGAHRQP